MEFKKYQRTNLAEMHQYDRNAIYPKEFWDKLSISKEDKANGSPKLGDMIARNPENHNDIWLVAKEYFDQNFVPAGHSPTNHTEEEINRMIETSYKEKVCDISKISDTYHTFGELYDFRKMYNALLFNEWAKQEEIIGFKNPETHEYPIFRCKYDVHKSLRHSDGNYCFDSNGKWFIVVAQLPTGQISNHYPIEDWDLFQIPETEQAKYEFDGHTPKDVLDRLEQLTK